MRSYTFFISSILVGFFQLAQIAASPVVAEPKAVLVNPTSQVQTSDEALQRLIAGNKRYTEDKCLCTDRDRERRAALVAKQNPFAIILGCSDSRVSPEIIFDQGVGDIFTVRVAGNVAGISELESIEYAIKHLNSLIVLVLGHENCGAVTAVVKNDAQDIPRIAALIEPVVKGIENADSKIGIEKAIKANVRAVVNSINNSAYLRPLLDQKKIIVCGGYYRLESGLVELVE